MREIFRGLFSFMIDITLKAPTEQHQKIYIFVYLFSSWILEYLLIFIYRCAVYFQLFPLLYCCCLNLLKTFCCLFFISVCIFAVSFRSLYLMTHAQTTTQVSARINGFNFFSIIDNFYYYYYFYISFHLIFLRLILRCINIFMICLK